MLAQTFHDFSRNAIGPTASIALHLGILFFIIAALVALASLIQPRKVQARWADAIGGAGMVALAVYFVARFGEAGADPLSNLFEIVALAALCLAVAYFIALRVRRMPALGAFAFPALCIIFLVNLLFAGGAFNAGSDDSGTPLLILHVVLILVSYSAFFMATVAAVMFLLQEHALKRHRDPAVIRSFPPLESLRRLVNACLWIGLPLLTLGLILGFAALSDEGWATAATNPKVPPSLVLWTVMVLVVAGRRIGVLHGRRHFYMVLLGFGLVLATFVGLGFYSAGRAG